MIINERITFHSDIMGGKPCVRGMRITVSMIISLLAEGYSREDILKAYPYIEDEDISACLNYAAFRVEEKDEPLALHSSHEKCYMTSQKKSTHTEGSISLP